MILAKRLDKQITGLENPGIDQRKYSQMICDKGEKEITTEH